MGDGFISAEDLGGMFGSMGKDHPADYLEAMVKEASADINFTTFLTLFGEKLHGTDPEDVILKAFKCFDPEGAKVINGDQLKRLLMAMGERFTAEKSKQCSTNGNVTKPVTSTTSNSQDWSSTVLERRNDELTYCGVHEELMNDSWALCLTCCKPVDIVDCLENITVTISNYLFPYFQHNNISLAF